MTKNLLLVDYENVPRIDMSLLDESWHAIIFVGARQSPPRAATNKSSDHRFKRVEFQKIAGIGKNALDFHIAFHLGRTFEAAADTVCTIVSRDKGYDPLILHLNENGLVCRRVESFGELLPPSPEQESASGTPATPKPVVCLRCGNSRTIEHLGGLWCVSCGSFAREPDPALLPSNQPGYREPQPRYTAARVRCGWCHQPSDMAGGIYDDGEWMCGSCIGSYTE